MSQCCNSLPSEDLRPSVAVCASRRKHRFCLHHFKFKIYIEFNLIFILYHLPCIRMVRTRSQLENLSKEEFVSEELLLIEELISVEDRSSKRFDLTSRFDLSYLFLKTVTTCWVKKLASWRGTWLTMHNIIAMNHLREILLLHHLAMRFLKRKFAKHFPWLVMRSNRWSSSMSEFDEKEYCNC